MASAHELSLLRDYLFDDHVECDGLLRRAIAAGGRFDERAYADFRTRMLRHIAIEELFVFLDARRRRRGVPLPDARRLRIEHAALRLLLWSAPSRPLVGEIMQLLLLHLGKEDGPRGVFEQHSRLASVDELRALACRAREFTLPPVLFDAPTDATWTARSALTAAEREPSVDLVI
jgi:hypothetical protein